MGGYEQARFYQIQKLADETIKPMGSYSNRALIAIMMIIAHESLKATLREQVISFDKREDRIYKIDREYARGICGMEKLTHDDLLVNSDNLFFDYVNIFLGGDTSRYHKDDLNVERLVYDDKYAIFMARKKLHMIPQALPNEPRDIAQYLVKYYNAGGKANAYGYLNDYLDWKG